MITFGDQKTAFSESTLHGSVGLGIARLDMVSMSEPCGDLSGIITSLAVSALERLPISAMTIKAGRGSWLL